MNDLRICLPEVAYLSPQNKSFSVSGKRLISGRDITGHRERVQSDLHGHMTWLDLDFNPQFLVNFLNRRP